jgi:hypothetical protein
MAPKKAVAQPEPEDDGDGPEPEEVVAAPKELDDRTLAAFRTWWRGLQEVRASWRGV